MTDLSSAIAKQYACIHWTYNCTIFEVSAVATKDLRVLTQLIKTVAKLVGVVCGVCCSGLRSDFLIVNNNAVTGVTECMI